MGPKVKKTKRTYYFNIRIQIPTHKGCIAYFTRQKQAKRMLESIKQTGFKDWRREKINKTNVNYNS